MIQTPLEPISTSEVTNPPVESDGSTSHNQRRGLLWIVGAFAICPCHLPFTLGLLATLLSGTGVGIAMQHYPIVAGVIITLVWAAATWRGFRYLRATNSLKTCQLKRR